VTTRAERGTSPWWLDQLGKKLADRRKAVQKFDDYYSGKQGRRILSTSYRVLFEEVLGAYAENFCGIVVDAIAQRLEVQGFRFPPADTARVRTPRDPGMEADRDAWRIWQDNQLDAESQIAHTEALIKSVSYVLVSPFPAEFVSDRSPRITIEDAFEAIVDYRAGTNERRIGMKRWWDEEENAYLATLYYPDRIEKWRADGRHTQESMAQRLDSGEGANWIKREVNGELWPLPNPLGVVPLVELRNKPRLGHRVESEIGQVIPIQDAINTLAFNELVASDAAAFPQKWATGVEIPIDAKTKKPPADWDPDINRILSTLVPDAKFGTFAAADLNQWGAAIDRRVKRIASITATPYHFFLDHGGQPPSGESLRAAEAGLVRKAMSKQVHNGETWEEVIRLAFLALGDERATILDSETIWANPETLTEAEHVDALVKLGSINVPDEQLWEDAGYSPNQITRFKALRAAEPAPEPANQGGSKPGDDPALDGAGEPGTPPSPELVA
jgi:hypothetical protein